MLKQNIEASKGQEYYADGLKLIFSGMPSALDRLATCLISTRHVLVHLSSPAAGKILNDAQTIAEYGIKETDFLVAMPGKVAHAMSLHVSVHSCAREVPCDACSPSSAPRCRPCHCCPRARHACCGVLPHAGPSEILIATRHLHPWSPARLLPHP